MRDNMHDWVVANERMAKVLTAKGYHYQFVFARNAGHPTAPYGQILPRPSNTSGRAIPSPERSERTPFAADCCATPCYAL